MMTTGVQEQAELVSAGLAVLAEPHRLLILRQLRRGPRSAGDLARAVGIAPSLASHHLSVLDQHGLVSRRRAGHFVCYAAEHERIRELYDRLGKLAGASGAAADAARARPDNPC
jgi:DNA-binding transcriptional ArsR family regulator